MVSKKNKSVRVTRRNKMTGEMMTEGGLILDKSVETEPDLPEQEEPASGAGVERPDLPERDDKFNPWDRGWLGYIERGAAKPLMGGVLIRAVLESDFTRFGAGLEDTRRAVGFEIVAIADDVPRGCGLEIGMVTQHLSASAMPVRGDSSQRHFLIHYTDFRLGVWPLEEVTQETETGDIVKVVQPRRPPSRDEEQPEQEAVNVTGFWPWTVEDEGGGKSFRIVDGAGVEVCGGMSQHKATLVADAANERAACNPREPQIKPAVTVEAEHVPEPSRPKKVTHEEIASIAQGLDQEQTSAVGLMALSSGLEAAKRLAGGFRLSNQAATPPPPQKIDITDLEPYQQEMVKETDAKSGRDAALSLIAHFRGQKKKT